ncbi:MAG TPA: YfbU family protein [Stellaceae bacterium]|nr:YfbU family protein [Stellaceae bacterium]
MTPKTERFEMRLDQRVLDRVDAWRSRQSDLPSRAEAIRRLIEGGLEEPDPKDFRPTNPEKLMMWMLAEIMKGQENYEKDTVELIQEAIYGGHFWVLDWELSGIMHNHVDSKKAVSLVVDVLDMWTSIERAYEGFSAADKKRIATEVGLLGKNPRFTGFDGNYEGEFMSIARFLVEKMGRFESFKGRDFNSHVPVAGRYRAMSAAFEPMRPRLSGRELSVGEVIELLKLQ